MSDAFSKSVDAYINALDNEREQKGPLVSFRFGRNSKGNASNTNISTASNRGRISRGSGVRFLQGQLNVFDSGSLQMFLASQPGKTKQVSQQALQQSIQRAQSRG